MNNPLGRLLPTDMDHVDKYPYNAVLTAEVTKVERVLRLPYYHASWNQGNKGACVGFGTSMMMAILNEQQARATKTPPYIRRYNALWLWQQARLHDEFTDNDDLSDDNQGTTVRAGCDILRTLGHERVIGRVTKQADIAEGIKENRWATSVDQIRSAISAGIPCSIGIDWMSNFDTPIQKNNEWWIGQGDLGYIRGGHCVCLYGASDKRQAFKLQNNWGKEYPQVWLSYSVMDKLFKTNAEVSLIVDR